MRDPEACALRDCAPADVVVRDRAVDGAVVRRGSSISTCDIVWRGEALTGGRDEDADALPFPLDWVRVEVEAAEAFGGVSFERFFGGSNTSSARCDNAFLFRPPGGVN